MTNKEANMAGLSIVRVWGRQAAALLACVLPLTGTAHAEGLRSPLQLPGSGERAVRFFGNPAAIPIPSVGPSSLYPSDAVVSGVSGSIWEMRVGILGLTHTRPDDIDVLLVSPAGTKVILHSDAGGDTDVSVLSYGIQDDPALPDIPDNAPFIQDAFQRNRDYEAPPDESFPAPAPPGPYYTSTSAFRGEDPNGTWSLYVRDDTAGDSGSIGGGFELTLGTADAGAPTTINDNVPATPYPHDFVIPPGQGDITNVKVVLRGLTHTFPDDLDILLLSPDTKCVMLMSDAGGGSDVTGVNLVLDDAAPGGVPDGTQIVAGTYRPADFETAVDFPDVTAQCATTLSALNNSNASGTWSLLIRDDKGQDVGSLLDWGLLITTAEKGDFNRDSSTDLLWRHDVSGQNVLWYMNGNALRTGELTDPAALADAAWKIVGTHDFNGDRKSDILWRHGVSGENVVWFMERNQLVSGTFTVPSALADVNWQMAGTGDFNGDAKPDILWRHDVSGQNVVWFMNGHVLTTGTFLNPPALEDVNWKMVGTGYFNGDDQLDILWWHQVSGQLVMWHMSGIDLVSGVMTTPSGLADVNWRPVAIGDFNFDERPDLVWRHQASGQNVLWYMGGADGSVLQNGEFTDPPVFADTRWKIVGPR
jgi:subtilisin-like proprotein convertase family protein